MPTPVLIKDGYVGNGFANKVIHANGNVFAPVFYAPKAAAYLPLVEFPGIAQDLQMFKTTDGGLTWAQIGVSGQALSGVQPAFDSDHTITCAMMDLSGGSQSFSLIDFNLATETWGAPYGSSASEKADILYGMFYRSDGSLVLVYGINVNGAGFANVKVGAYKAGWTFAAIDTNVPALQNSDFAVSCILDKSDRLHVVIGSDFDHGFPWYNTYQQVAIDLSLGPFENLSAADYPDFVYTAKVGMPAVSDTNDWIVIPYSFGSFAGFFFGSGLSAPAWSTSGALTADQMDNVATASLVGTALYFGGFLNGIFSGATVYALMTQNLTNPKLGWTSVSYDVSAEYQAGIAAVGGQALT